MLRFTGKVGLLLIAGFMFSPSIADAGPKHCPPGLAKKGSCTPPGLQKKYGRGDSLHGIRYRVLRHDRFDLPRPRPGEIYIETGGRIYLLAEATQRVIEALNLIDAATR